MSLSTDKIHALTSSTLPLILERQRSISIGLQPPAFTEATILKNLNLIHQALQAVHLEASTGLQVGAGQGGDAKRMKDGLDRLLGLMDHDPAGKEIVRPIRQSLTQLSSPSEPEPNAIYHQFASPSLPSTHLTRTSDPSFPPAEPPRPPASFASYRDEEDQPSPFEEPYRDDSQIMFQQREMMSDQDARLAQLSTSINRQHHLSLQIGDELEVHQDLLEDTDQALDRTAVRLARARRQLDGFAGKAKENASAITIVILIVLLAILILVFKT